MTGTQRAIGPLCQQRGPAVRQTVAGALRRGGFEQFARQILNQHLCPAAITVSQRQVFSSWRTLPGQGRRVSAVSVSGCRFWLRRLTLWRRSAGSGAPAAGCLHGAAQRRQVYADHVQAVEQILAELAFLHPQLQVLVRGGDDAYVDLHRRIAADPVELAVRQHPQQARLHVERHIADPSRNSAPPSACSKRP